MILTQQNPIGRSVKAVHTNVFAKNLKLHKFATCDLNLEKSYTTLGTVLPFQL